MEKTAEATEEKETNVHEKAAETEDTQSRRWRRTQKKNAEEKTKTSMQTQRQRPMIRGERSRGKQRRM